VALRDPARAIEIGERIDADRLPPALTGRRAQVHIDLATAWAQTQRSDGNALLHLLEAERIAPEAIHMGHAARSIIADLAARPGGRRTPGLLALADRAGVAA